MEYDKNKQIVSHQKIRKQNLLTDKNRVGKGKWNRETAKNETRCSREKWFVCFSYGGGGVWRLLWRRRAIRWSRHLCPLQQDNWQRRFCESGGESNVHISSVLRTLSVVSTEFVFAKVVLRRRFWHSYQIPGEQLFVHAANFSSITFSSYGKMTFAHRSSMFMSHLRYIASAY